ncbi:hypothetical protein GCM10025789_18940 [Tessaracoccus lubricantis]|uniref:ECF transporter S component CbiN n=1 Tax=Tessaracoccus lubricantis TaxID=545543 RepID=A0ABP9FEL8_9ACTN
MSEATTHRIPLLSRRDWLIGAALVALLVAGFAAVVLLAPSGAGFAGTDATGAELIPAEPWVTPPFSPGSLGSEVESGLFALQAALGGIILGFVLGRLTGRRSTAAQE